MNRRDLLKGLSVALVAASIPITVEQLVAIPDTQMVAYLRNVRDDLIHKIVNPPCIMHEDGRVEQMSTEVSVECLKHVLAALRELA